MSISQGFEIDSLIEFHDLYEHFINFLKQNSKSKKQNLKNIYVIFQCTFATQGFSERLLLQKFGIEVNMRVVIGYSNVSNICGKTNDQRPFWQNNNYKGTWADIYDNDIIFPRTTSPMLLVDGNYILKHKIGNLNDISFENILLIYIPNICKSSLIYSIIVSTVNMYYESSPFEAKINQKDPQRVFYKSVSHGFTVHGGKNSLENMVRYDHEGLSEDLKEALRSQGDTIAYAIWEQFNMFGDSIKSFFQEQIKSMAPLAIGLEGFEIPVHQLHASKNYYIKPHIDKSDFEACLIAWFMKGNPKGGYFGIFQHGLKFDNNNGAGIFVRSKYLSHGTLKFDMNSLSAKDFKLGVALVNKCWAHTRYRNQLIEATPITWENRRST